jgi:hypothetical protein
MVEKIGIAAVIGASAAGKIHALRHLCILLLELLVDIFQLSQLLF